MRTARTVTPRGVTVAAATLVVAVAVGFGWALEDGVRRASARVDLDAAAGVLAPAPGGHPDDAKSAAEDP